MQIRVLASTKVGYEMPKEEAVNFSGKSAGICYLPDSLDTLFSEDPAKTERRAKGTLASGHHSVFGHVTYNLALEGIPKILAMILNNEKIYNTSEKSARYTKMEPSEKEKVLYEKWIEIYQKEIQKHYPNIDDKRSKKLAQENARYLISVFTPATIMEYTVSFGQLNYIAHWFENFVKNAEDTKFNAKLKKVFIEFNDKISDLIIPELNSDVKGRTFSLFAPRARKEEFGENYCINYEGTFAQLAQAQRHRTTYCEISFMNKSEFFVPSIIKGTELENEWIKDISSLEDEFPQGLLLKINERGTVENFIMKCQERLCGAAQLEIAIQTKENLNKYINAVKENGNEEIYNYLLQYTKGARCTFPGWRCNSPCIWGAKNALNRLV